MKFLITGANGFVGKNLCCKFSDSELIKIVRQSDVEDEVSVGEIDGATDWLDVLVDIKVVIHTAARVHVMNDSVTKPLDEFRKVNTFGTINLARQAAESGVKRFIFISSVKVNGEATSTTPFTAEDKFIPSDPYGLSKYEAEQELLLLAKETGMEVVIIRPPLVYGPDVKGNFSRMIRWVERGIPLPLGGLDNCRSLIGLDNLIDLIVTCIAHPAASNQIFLASDGEDMSTSELLRRVGKASGRSVSLLPIPSFFLQFVANLLGKGEVAQRLLGSLQVDISKTKELLGWKPPLSVDEGLRRAVKAE